jgi:hypothetical protein
MKKLSVALFVIAVFLVSVLAAYFFYFKKQLDLQKSSNTYTIAADLTLQDYALDAIIAGEKDKKLKESITKIKGLNESWANMYSDVQGIQDIKNPYKGSTDSKNAPSYGILSNLVTKTSKDTYDSYLASSDKNESGALLTISIENFLLAKYLNRQFKTEDPSLDEYFINAYSKALQNSDEIAVLKKLNQPKISEVIKTLDMYSFAFANLSVQLGANDKKRIFALAEKNQTEAQSLYNLLKPEKDPRYALYNTDEFKAKASKNPISTCVEAEKNLAALYLGLISNDQSANEKKFISTKAALHAQNAYNINPTIDTIALLSLVD